MITTSGARFDSNYWLCTIELDPSLRIKGQENAYKEVIKTAVGGAAGVYASAPAYVNGVSESVFKVGMCLPAGPYVSEEDVRYIVECIREARE